eukprot:11925276-Alexandrium_andersonii.AAC.2
MGPRRRSPGRRCRPPRAPADTGVPGHPAAFEPTRWFLARPRHHRPPALRAACSLRLWPSST